jgi:hypothetical protein
MLTAPLPPSICMTASVAVSVSPTPGQVVQVLEPVVPEASKDGVDPNGGLISTKFPPQKAPGLPERLTVTRVVPPLPLRLYAMSMLAPSAALKMWQLLAGHSVQDPPPPVTEEIVTLLGVWIYTTHTVPACVGSMLPTPYVQLVEFPVHTVIRLSCSKVQV